MDGLILPDTMNGIGTEEDKIWRYTARAELINMSKASLSWLPSFKVGTWIIKVGGSVQEGHSIVTFTKKV